MSLLRFASVTLHVLAASVWIGSLVCMAAVVVPAVMRPAPRPDAALLLQRAGARLRVLGWTCLGLLVATGLANLALLGIDARTLAGPAFWGSPFGRTLALKLACVAGVIAATAVHEVTSVARAADAAGDARDERARRLGRLSARLALVFTIAAASLGVVLVRGQPW